MGPDNEERRSLGERDLRTFYYKSETYEELQVGDSKPDWDWSGVINKTVWVVDSSGDPVLRFEGRHYERRACTKVILRNQSMLRFPVTGRWNRAVMSAFDESGNALIHYRLGPPTQRLPIYNYSLKRVESVVSPVAREITEIAVIVATTPRLLFGYFVSPSSGG